MSQTAMRVSDQWGGNHVFFRCCCFGTAMRVKNKYGPFGSLGGLVAGSVLHLAFVEVPYFSSRTYGISTAVFCALALLSAVAGAGDDELGGRVRQLQLVRPHAQ